MALAAAWLTLAAHGGRPALDLLGKQIAFAAALFTVAAGLCIFVTDLATTAPPASESTSPATPTSTSTCTPVGRYDTRAERSAGRPYGGRMSETKTMHIWMLDGRSLCDRRPYPRYQGKSDAELEALREEPRRRRRAGLAC